MLPPIFQQYESVVSYVRQVSDTEWSSSCPSCGGEPHENREPPDRCRWFLRGTVLGWCRKCGSLFFPENAPGYNPPTAEELAQWTQERIAAEMARKRSAERALAHLRDSRIWEKYHAELGEQGRNYWRKAGIPDGWQDWWKFGWCNEYSVYRKDGIYLRSTATIPIFGFDWEPLQVKHRVIWTEDDPKELQNDKYRSEIKTGEAPFFLCDPEKPIGENVILVEGEKKAACVAVTLDDASVSIVGLPGIRPDTDRFSMFENAQRITLVTDPGSRVQTWKLCKKLGRERCFVVLPEREKIDDGIIASQMTKNELRSLFRQAIPAA